MRALGVVKDASTGEVLPGAHVAVLVPVQCMTAPCEPQMITGTTTDSNGLFELNVNPGQSVRVSYIGYSDNYPILVDGQEVAVEMIAAENSPGEVVVTASKALPFWAKTLIFLGFVVLVIGGIVYFFNPDK